MKVKTIGFERKPVKNQPAKLVTTRLLQIKGFYIAAERRVQNPERTKIAAELVTTPWEGK